MGKMLADSVEILSTQVAKLDSDPENATEHLGPEDTPVLTLTVRLGARVKPRILYLQREQLVRLRDLHFRRSLCG